MKDLSLSAKVYILGSIFAGGLVIATQLVSHAHQLTWLYLFLSAQAILTLFIKKDSPGPRLRMATLIALLLISLPVGWWSLSVSAGHTGWAEFSLGLLAAASHIAKRVGSTQRSSHQASFIVYGLSFILVGMPSTVVIILIAHLIEYAWGDFYPWFIQAFNTAVLALSMLAAGVVFELINPSGAVSSSVGVAALLLAFAIFTLVNHLLVGLVLKLARGQNLRESGVFGLMPLMMDYCMLIMGSVSAVLWGITPFASVMGAIPLYLIFSTLQVPALKRQTETDPKTGLFNARYFTKMLDEEFERSVRFDRHLVVVMSDLDLLRNINNNYGHLAGDLVLEGIAKTMKEMARGFDVVARFGGEEFAVLMPETTLEEGYRLADEMRQAIGELSFTVSSNNEPIKATMSFGVAQLADSDQSTEALVHCADLALYQAKAQGRNRTVAYNQDNMRDMPEVKGHDGQAAVGETTIAPKLKDLNHESPAAAAPKAPKPDEAQPPAKQPETGTEKVGASSWDDRINRYIAAVTFAAIVISAISWRGFTQIDWIGLLVFTIAAFLTEYLSLEIFVRDTSVSTSAAVLVAGSLLFGPVGAVILGVAAAAAVHAKHRLWFRSLFNASNFIIGNMLAVILESWYSRPTVALSQATQLLVCAISVMLVYMSTTWLVAGAVSISTGQAQRAIWIERFRWLAPYYLALGIGSFALIIGFISAGWLGVAVILVPIFMLRFSQMQYLDHTKTMANQLRSTNTELVRQADEITLLNEELLLTLARTVDIRDPHVLEHSKNVARYASLIAVELGLSEDQIELIRKAGLLHDIGKLGVPESILFKPASLDRDEYEHVKTHVDIGAELIYGCRSLRTIIPFVKHHHEFIDGRGYPDGLSGEDIPLEARILALADAVEAMASDRPYKKAMSATEILSEIDRCAGTQFDTTVAQAFKNVVHKCGSGVVVNSARGLNNSSWATAYPGLAAT